MIVKVCLSGFPIGVLVKQLGGASTDRLGFSAVFDVEILDGRIYQLWLGQRDCAIVVAVDSHSKEIADRPSSSMMKFCLDDLSMQTALSTIAFMIPMRMQSST